MIDITHPSPSPKTNKEARIQGIPVSTEMVDIIMREEQCVSVLSRVIEIATRLFIEKGHKGTKISDIFAETGIHIGSIYNIFRDKEDIVCEIVIRDYALMLGRADRIDAGDLVKKVAYPMAAEFRLARLGPNVARILSVAYSSSKTMDALTDMQCGLLERYCEETGILLGIDAIKRRMCAVNGLIGGLFVCPSVRRKGTSEKMSGSRWRRTAVCSVSRASMVSRWWMRRSVWWNWIRRRDTCSDSRDEDLRRTGSVRSERNVRFRFSPCRYETFFGDFLDISSDFTLFCDFEKMGTC